MTVRVSDCDAVCGGPAESDTPTKNVDVAPTGTPLIWPAEVSASPAGSEPDEMLHRTAPTCPDADRVGAALGCRGELTGGDRKCQARSRRCYLATRAAGGSQRNRQQDEGG